MVFKWRGSFYSEDQISGMGVFPNVLLETAPGRAYLKTAPFQDLRPVIDKRLADWNGSECAAFFDSWEENIKQELE